MRTSGCRRLKTESDSVHEMLTQKMHLEDVSEQRQGRKTTTRDVGTCGGLDSVQDVIYMSCTPYLHFLRAGQSISTGLNPSNADTRF